MAHDLTTPYVPGPPLEVDLPSGWTFTTDAAGYVAGSGPCPWCLGPAYGPPLLGADSDAADSDADTSDTDTGPTTREFIAACSCGGPHGKDHQPSCGRTFLVRAPREEPT